VCAIVRGVSIGQLNQLGFSFLYGVPTTLLPNIPPSRTYKGDVIYWWNHLYKHASSIEMGNHDWNVVLKFLIEAEQAGILGGGCAEEFRAQRKKRMASGI